MCRVARDAPYLGDTVLASALAQIYTVKLRYFDKLSSGYKRGFQCFAQQQVCPPLPPHCPVELFCADVVYDFSSLSATRALAACIATPQLDTYACVRRSQAPAV